MSRLALKIIGSNDSIYTNYIFSTKKEGQGQQKQVFCVNVFIHWQNNILTVLTFNFLKQGEKTNQNKSREVDRVLAAALGEVGVRTCLHWPLYIPPAVVSLLCAAGLGLWSEKQLNDPIIEVHCYFHRLISHFPSELDWPSYLWEYDIKNEVKQPYLSFFYFSANACDLLNNSQELL